jgi:hypothetical protein
MITALLPFATKLVDKLLPDPQAKAQAQMELAKMAQEGALATMANETELFKAEQSTLTERHHADMSSDSWLSKNIRPMTLVAIFAAYFLFALMSAFNHNANESYVQLLGQWGMLVMSFYFGGRSLEKIMEIYEKKSKAKSPQP